MRPPSPASAADAVRGDIGYTPREVNRDCAGCDRSSPAATVRDQDRSDAARERGYRRGEADQPVCRRQRTQASLSGLGRRRNPYYRAVSWRVSARSLVGLPGAAAQALWTGDCAHLPGHGHSQWAPSYGPAAHIADLKAFLRDHMPTPVLLVGHSMGGEISQRIAFDCPELLEALVLVDSPHGGPPLKTRMMWRWKRRNQDGPRPEFGNAADLVRRFRLSPPGHFLSPEALAELAMKGSEQLPNGNWAFRFDPKTRKPTGGWRRVLKFPLQQIRMPVLILRGEHSGLLTAQTGRWMHRRIHGSIYREISALIITCRSTTRAIRRTR